MRTDIALTLYKRMIVLNLMSRELIIGLLDLPVTQLYQPAHIFFVLLKYRELLYLKLGIVTIDIFFSLELVIV